MSGASSTSEGATETVAKPAEEPVAPETLPKLTLDVLGLVSQAQSVHGLRRQVPDYQRYAKFCGEKLRRLRRNLRFTYGKKKFTFHELTPSNLKNERYLVIPLMNAERCWATFLDLQRQQELVKDENSRIKFHALKKLKKAAQWAKELKDLCVVRATERTRLEATGYHLWMEGLLLREQGKWVEAGQSFQGAFDIFDGLSNVGESAGRAIAKGRADNIQPLIAYCAYRGGVDTASFAGKTGAASGALGDAKLLDSFLVQSKRAEAQQTTVELDGGARRATVDPQSTLGPMIVQCRFLAFEASSPTTSTTQAQTEESALLALVKQCKAAEDWLACAANLVVTASESRAPAPATSAAGSSNKRSQKPQHVVTEADTLIVKEWASLQKRAARARRNELLIDAAVVRCVMRSPAGSTVPVDVQGADARWRQLLSLVSNEADARSFVSATNEWLGVAELDWTGVARMVDQLVSLLLSDTDHTDEQERLQHAATIVQLRGLRALFLSLHMYEQQRWPESMALAIKATQTMGDSQAQANKAGAARWSAVCAHLLRMLRVRSASATKTAEPAMATSEVSSLEEDAFAVVVPGKVALFDLAGTEVTKFPSLEGRLKKKGFLSSWWG